MRKKKTCKSYKNFRAFLKKDMKEESQVQLNTASVLHVPLQIYDNDFSFIVNGEEFKTSRIISDLLSPKISAYHQSDPTLSEFTITTKTKGHFSYILQLSNFTKFSIPDSEIDFFSEVIEILGNEAIEIINLEPDREITEDNVITLLQQHQKNPKLYKTRINDEIEFITSHFFILCENNSEELQKLNIETLERIIFNTNLRLQDEDQLLSFINKMYSKSTDKSIARLYDFVLFSNVEEETMREFVDTIDFCDLTFNMWASISNRLKNMKEFHGERYQTKHKQITQTVLVGGYNRFNQLDQGSNNKNVYNEPSIHPPQKSSIDFSSLLSYSVYRNQSVMVTSDGSLLGIGENSDGRISASLQKIKNEQFTEFSITDGDGNKLTPVSAVCCYSSTLYMLKKSSGNGNQLVLCDSDINGGNPVFLDIGDEEPVALFGGRSHSSAISIKGEVIFINHQAVKNSPSSRIAAVSLPSGEKASFVACIKKQVVVLSSNGRVFQSTIDDKNNVLEFSAVEELAGKEIVSLSGTEDHCLAVSKEGRVYALGSNKNGQLGLGERTESVSSFTLILSLGGQQIRAAYAGNNHSLFETQEGKILSCGSNTSGQLLLDRGPCFEIVYSPTKSTITSGATFCIAGLANSIVFIGCPPPNTPNKRI